MTVASVDRFEHSARHDHKTGSVAPFVEQELLVLLYKDGTEYLLIFH